MAHTPPPWGYDPVKPHKLRSYAPEWGAAGSPSIAYIKEGSGSRHASNWEANRQLIATAPELLAAL